MQALPALISRGISSYFPQCSTTTHQTDFFFRFQGAGRLTAGGARLTAEGAAENWQTGASSATRAKLASRTPGTASDKPSVCRVVGDRSTGEGGGYGQCFPKRADCGAVLAETSGGVKRPRRATSRGVKKPRRAIVGSRTGTLDFEGRAADDFRGGGSRRPRARRRRELLVLCEATGEREGRRFYGRETGAHDHEDLYCITGACGLDRHVEVVVSLHDIRHGLKQHLCLLLCGNDCISIYS